MIEKRNKKSNVNKKGYRTTYTKMPTKTVTGLEFSKVKKTPLVPKSIAKKAIQKGAEKAADSETNFIHIMNKYNSGARNAASKAGFKVGGKWSENEKMTRVKQSTPRVIGAKTKTTGKPSTSKTVKKKSKNK